MTTKELLNDEALEQVTGGSKGFVYYRDNGKTYDAFVCDFQLTDKEIANLLNNGVTPKRITLNGASTGHLVLGLEKGTVATDFVNLLQASYTELSYTAV